MLTYPMTTGRNFDEILRVLDSMQLTAKHKVATPANWKHGDDVIIAGSVTDDDAKKALSRRLESSRSPICASSSNRGERVVPNTSSGEEAWPAVFWCWKPGSGGLELSTFCRRGLAEGVDVMIIDRSDAFMFGYSKLDVMFGHTTIDAARLPYKTFAKLGVASVAGDGYGHQSGDAPGEDRRRRPRLRHSSSGARRRLRSGSDSWAGIRERVLLGRRTLTNALRDILPTFK